MKKRIDQLLVEQGLAENLARAQALVMAGLVYQGTLRLDKPGIMVAKDSQLTVKGREHPYVSRGGIKLAAGLDHFHIDPKGLIALDVGSSTGGFTDVLLRRGAAKVYAVDVGTNQLAWSLRNDPRVVVMEQTDARGLTREHIPDAPDIIVCDASFIPLEQVLPAALALAKAGTHLVALIKPQFEVAKGQVGQGGIITDPDLHAQSCADVHAWLATEMKWEVAGIIESPIKGAEGNTEFLIGAMMPKLV